ncbi:DUF1592 domain-containing protein [Novosphingobium umbonatum]|uniref:DUF1592 domain-containing protein n=1 Tax=Novosphingobium umbonatum TaxID=1908524 RepID=A0A437N6V9_9SPHN|nr:DUF1592 domain-containing protein [Novosphingobium umbonatum]RVU05676.1 DUF1592 domain-containing protein [Novosphingobium umbonatum]
MGRIGAKHLARASLAVSLLAMLATGALRSAAPSPAPKPFDGKSAEAMVGDYCASCHNDIDQAGSLSFDDLRGGDIAAGRHAESWEAILRKVVQDEMPPHTKRQPSPEMRAAFVRWVASGRDAFAAAHPDPGKATLRRLNRVEYAAAVRDLLALDVDVARDLPQDNSGYGFDNIADVLSVSPTLVERYVSVAGKVARLATGLDRPRASVASYIVSKDGSIMNSGRPAYNERMSEELPPASRGGGIMRFYARAGGDYDVVGWLNANTNNESDRLPQDRVSARVKLSAGAHRIGMAFRRELAPDESVQFLRNNLDEVPLPVDKPVMLPLDVLVDGRRVTTLQVPSYRLSDRYAQQNFPRDVMEIDVAGPAAIHGPQDTPSRRRIFTCRPASSAQEEACARQILSSLARHAYRRNVGAEDLAPLLRAYGKERAATGQFERGIEAGVAALLVSPHFLFQAESDPAGAVPGSVHPVSDRDLATRLALFLWSSLPDETLLRLAEKRQLHRSEILSAQAMRMLDDPRAKALTQHFAGQWLYLRNLDQQRPDTDLFPQFDTRLRSAMAAETELFFAHLVTTNGSLLDFLSSDYTFLNQRLAEHYGITGVRGTAMRKVTLDPRWGRGGLLGQASILTVTSYGNHTSVVKRGKWVLENLLASPPPPPPPDVPALKASHEGKLLSAREQLELHRADPACAACHVRMDPIGFAMENFDAIGAHRQQDAGQLIDASASLPDGTRFTGLPGLRGILLARKDQFTQAFTEKLMTYALGRGVIAADRPQIRAIARMGAADHFRIRTIIRGIVLSDAFRLRKVPVSAARMTLTMPEGKLRP